jgi:predicted RNA-binding protein with PUA domain
LLIDVSSCRKLAAESSEVSSVNVDNLARAQETITRLRSIIEEQASACLFLNDQLVLAEGAVTNLSSINRGLEIDVAYLADQRRYSSILANKVEEAHTKIEQIFIRPIHQPLLAFFKI